MIHSFGWLMIEAGTSLFEIILILTFMNGFLTPKEKPFLQKLIVLGSALVMLFFVSTYLYNIANLLSINFFVISFIISITLFSGKLSHRFFSCILLLAVLVVVELITMCIMVLCLNIDAAVLQSEPMLKFIGVVLKNILSFAVIKVICNFRKSNMYEMGKAYFALLFVIPVICVVVALTILDIVLAYDIKDLTGILLAYLGLMYVNAIVFVIFEGLMRQLDKEYKYKIIEKQLELQLNHYNKLAESRAVLSETIHDFRNHLNCIYNLYKYNDQKELGRYIENLINVSDVEKVIDTGNPVIDALLNDKYTIAKKLGIEFRKELNLPSNLRIAPTDICAILGNSLDNAIEACKRMKNVALRREISLSMTYHDSYLIIVVVNTFDQPPLKEGRFFRSLKPSPELHGFGIHSIERTVKKYDGNMVIKCDQGLFKLEIVMSTA